MGNLQKSRVVIMLNLNFGIISKKWPLWGCAQFY